MEETLEAPQQDEWRSALEQSIEAARRRLGERVASQRQRLRDLEARIAGQVADATEALAREQDAARQEAAQLQQQDASAKERKAELDRRAAGLADREQAWDAARQECDRQLQQLLADLTRQAAELDRRQAALAREQESLAQGREELATSREAISRRQSELDQLRTGLAGQMAALQERADVCERRAIELQAAQQSHQAEVAQQRQQAEELRRQEAALARRSQELQDREHQAQRQRKHVAQQLRAKKQELTAEIERHRAEALASASGQELPLQLRLAELQGKYDRLGEELEQRQRERDEAASRLSELLVQVENLQQDNRQQQAALAESRQKQNEQHAAGTRLAELQNQLELAERKAAAAQALEGELEKTRREAHEQINHLRGHYDKLCAEQVAAVKIQLEVLRSAEGQWKQERQRLESEIAAAKQSAGESPAAAKERVKLQDECKQLRKSLAEAEEKSKQASGGGGQDMDDLRRRFEMAVQDVRELKTKNAELCEQLSQAKRSATAVTSAVTGASGQDWESVKRQMLAQMETDFSEENAAQKADKLTVQGAIKITDQVVAEKERELQELRELLKSQSKQVGEVAVGAAAFAEILDADEIIRQEREALQKLQESLREQSRKAEVDISLERAKLARERNDIDEKLRGLESERSANPKQAEAAGDGGKKPAGRKWLTRLGLGDAKAE